MSRFFSALSLTAVLCFSSMLSAQQTFTDRAEWEAEICGTIVSDDFTSLIEADGFVLGSQSVFTVPAPQTLSFGTVSTDTGSLTGVGQFDSGFGFGETEVVLSEDGIVGLAVGVQSGDILTLTFTPDASRGNLEGFCLDYGDNAVITIFDGTDIVDTIIAPAPPTGGIATICWLNSDQVNVTSFDFSPAEGTQFDAIINVDFAFGDGCDPPAETCRSQLEDLIADLATIDTGNSDDDPKIDCALYYLTCATDDSLWIDDDHLVENCNFFFFARKGNRYLTWVSSNPEIDQLLEDIQSVLSCIADNEIMAATAAGGNSNALAWAEYYQGCADYFQSIGWYNKAAKFRKLAWVFAVLA